MRRAEFRELVVKHLYTQAVGGDICFDDVDPEIIKRLEAINQVLDAIDAIISKNLTRYTIDRLNFVDLAIIRNAVYEMKYTKLPTQIVINEAINLTKLFSNLDDDAAKRFNNKLLDTIAKTLKD